MTSRSTIDQAALAVCSREPIHIPGAIQPHGVLLVLDAGNAMCLQASTNAATVLGCEPADCLGKDVGSILGEGGHATHAACLLEDPSQASPVKIALHGADYHCVIHRHDGVVIAEFEPAAAEDLTLQRRLQEAIGSLRTAEGLPALHQRLADFVADLTGFERVMVYRFDADWHGEVVGECLRAEVDSYMGHHFPASDIPEQARALYRKNWLRLIPDATYQAVPLEPALNPVTARPLDLTYSVLRSVSPVHLEYLRNMDVAASMSISLMVEDRLWGLIACHHRTPLHLAYAVRAACELFGRVASLEIAAKVEKARLTSHHEAIRIQTRFFDFIAKEQNFVEALVKYTPQLLKFMNAGGAAISVNGQLTLLGSTPLRREVVALVQWLERTDFDTVFVTDSLSAHLPEAAKYQETASGLLAVKLSRVEPHYVLWFRPEVITTVTWAGNPHKPTGENLALHPRKSFASWKERVTGHSLPWSAVETHGANELRSAINALVLRRTEKLIRVNEELERKNTDLNSFAYIAAHDLKEPLRGIANYARFIHEDHGAALDADASQKLQKISDLALHCQDLIGALNHYSRVGRLEIRRRPTQLGPVVAEALHALETLITETGVEIRQPHPYPEVSCDPLLVRELLVNLISNAIRYNTSSSKWVEIGMRAPDSPELPPVAYVRDNGIGIREKHFSAIFDIFRRLHPDDQYGKGTGAGLAISRSIVEKHGGRIWVESEPGAGSTFCFTLA